MRTKEIVGAILALTIFLGLASIALADAPGTPFAVGGHVYLGATIVSGADVTVTNQATGEFLTDTTDSNGTYVVYLNNLPGGHSAGDTIQVTATYNGQTGTSSAPRSENLDDSPQIIDVTIAQAVQIKAGDGSDLPDSILVGETFTVLITKDGSSVGAGTNVAFRLPYDTGSPTLDTTDADGKARYLPLNPGILGIRVLDGTGTTVVEANVTVTTTTGIQTLTVTADPTSVIVDSPTDVLFTVKADGSAVEGALVTLGGCGVDASDTTGASGTATIPVTATSVGMIDVTVTKTGYNYATTTITVDGPVISGDNTTPVISGCANVTGNFAGTVTVQALGNVTEVSGGSTVGLVSGGVPLMGATVNATLGDGEWVRLEMNYTGVDLSDVDEDNIEIYKFNVTSGEWYLVREQPYCLDDGRDTAANYVWVEVNNLSTFAIVGKTTTPRSGGGGGSSGGTYPPGWGTTTTTPAVTATAAPGATPGVTPPGEAVTTPTKPVVAEETAPEEAEETPTKKKTPGFTAVFAIAGLLAIAYAMMRRRD